MICWKSRYGVWQSSSVCNSAKLDFVEEWILNSAKYLLKNGALSAAPGNWNKLYLYCQIIKNESSSKSSFSLENFKIMDFVKSLYN